MTTPEAAETVAGWDRWWHERMAVNEAGHVPLQTLEDLSVRYRQLDAADQEPVAAFMSGMTASDDASERWFAVAFVREFRLVQALPTLRAYADRLEAGGPLRGPAAADLEKVRALVADLGSDDQG